MAEASKPAEPQTAEPAEPAIDLKDPALAAILAWLIPGLGHWYQGRRAKAVLYFVAILGLFGYGLCLGGSSRTFDDNGRKVKIGYGRAVYFAWRNEEWRFYYLGQVFVGLPALPALYQANRMSNGDQVRWGGFMAPPLPDAAPGALREGDPNADQPTRHDLYGHVGRPFELATFFTMVAGLLNVLAIYDAWGGPFVPPPKGKERKKDEENSDSAEGR